MTNASERPIRLAVLISGGGRTLLNLLDKISAGELHASVMAVISSKAGVRGLEIADRAGIPSAVVHRSAFGSDAEFSAGIYRAIETAKPDLIICAGFLKRLVVPTEWDNRILNIHPALIPESNAAGVGFYGDRVHQAVIDSGTAMTGATVHVVDNEYDHGPVVLKQAIAVRPGEHAGELGARVFEVECTLFPRAIQAHIAANPHLLGRAAGCREQVN